MTDKHRNAFLWYLKRTFCTKTIRIPRNGHIYLDSNLGPWLKATRHIEYQFYCTLEWVYETTTDNNNPAILRYCNASNRTNMFYKQDIIESMHATAISTDVVVRQNYVS